MSTPSSDLTPDTIMQMVYAFQRSRVLLTAFELEVFTVIGDASKTAAEIAAAVAAHPRAAERLLDALAALKFVVKRDGRYVNSPGAARFLVKGKPDFMGGLYHSAHLWDSWTTLTGAVRKGRSVRDRVINEMGDDWLGAFIGAMHWRAVRRASDLAASIDLAGVTRVLDVGGGSGAFSLGFVRAREGIRATVFDLPNVVPLTRKYIEEGGLAEKIDIVVGDYHSDDLGRGFDLAFLSAIVHSNSQAENTELLRKCAKALRPGGRVVISDWVMADDRASPIGGALFSLNMLVGTEAGDTFTESEIRSWLDAAGFADIRRQDTGSDISLMIAVKK